MRCFIAIDIDQANKKALSVLQKRLQDSVDIKKSDVKWVRPDNIHLTLKFLGEIKDAEAAEVCEAAREVSTRYESFELIVESVGYFGGKSARVLWVGMGEGRKQLFELQQDLEQRLVAVGLPKDTRQFNGHLTLCRVRNSKAGVKLAKVTEEYKEFRLGVISVDSVCVYQSQLRPDGPVYTLLGKYDLR